VDSGSLNSERGLVERIVPGTPHHLHRPPRRMIDPALGAGILVQFSACTREMRILGSHPAARSQVAKRMILAAKVVGFETIGCSDSHKEKNSYGDTLNLLRFFAARCLLRFQLR
jgi:hypothetical protein